MTVDGASAPVPLDLADLSTMDHLGATYRLVLAPGQPTPPTVVTPGHSVAFRVRARMRTGEGLMRWAPHDSLVASWDFEVEND